jgi:hypothetical protein
MDWLFPPLPLSSWRATRDAIQSYAQLMGKIRRELTPPQKHWWHVSLRVAATGLTTTPIPAGRKTFELLLDLVEHRLAISTSHGERRTVPLHGQAAATFFAETSGALAEMGIEAAVDKRLSSSEVAGEYDETAVANFWQALSQIDVTLKQFRSGFRGESSPVQLWPHHFDLAVVWFSGRLVPDQDPDDPEYADEQMNFGFSTGDEGIVEPYFYATAYPSPDGFTARPLPGAAYWHDSGWTGAVLPYEALTTAAEPHALLLEFLQSAHRAGKGPGYED